MLTFPQNDADFEEYALESVKGDSAKGWEIRFDGCTCFYVPASSPIEPKPGMVARFYPGGMGFAIRGLFLDGQKVFYRTAAEQVEKNRQDLIESERKRREEAEANKAATEARIAALPAAFIARIKGFRHRNPDFWWKHEPYELFVCEQAVAIADALKDAERVRAFRGLRFNQQKMLVPALSDGHSGNTFGASCTLAEVYLSRPESVAKMHGALCPLTGCADYGCWSTEAGKAVA